MSAPLISAIILNFNGKKWLPRCIGSLGEQTILSQIEIVVVDNASSDGSAQLASDLIAKTGATGKLLETGANLGYCEGNNRGAAAATGKYLIFLNTDLWLEKDCLEALTKGAESAKADCASPMVLDYDNDNFQFNGATGYDAFGYLSTPRLPNKAGSIFAVPGCALLVTKAAFNRIGGFDKEFFMYADEADLAWRLNVSGAKTITVPQSRVHHRGAAAANPKGNEKVVEFRTTEMVRFFATRNSLLLLLKNAQHLLLFLCLTQLVWVGMEIIGVLLLTRSLRAVHRGYILAVADVWRLRNHVLQERIRIKTFRKRGDWWMLRFFRLRPGRWHEIKRVFQLGPPKVN
jgi:N-acetylglucosaminyl-diphospho-decaprenol L-rhamnosyltransferase